jgi:hypothetical protein
MIKFACNAQWLPFKLMVNKFNVIHRSGLNSAAPPTNGKHSVKVIPVILATG